MLKLELGDCLQVMKGMEDNSVDSIITDPPYGLSFMGKKWDYDVPSVEIWKEAFRVLKPGGHLLSFAGSRTYHRMVVNIEDAGFEIRDQIMWVYGSGFPKSHNVGKAIDKAATPEAERWDGWGTALKPSHEPIVLARKPLIGTVAENVLEHGTGAMNIDACRIETDELKDKTYNNKQRNDINIYGGGKGIPQITLTGNETGRFPANFIHDGSDEVVSLLPNDSSRFFYCAKASKTEKGCENNHPTVKPVDLMRYLCRLVTPPEGVVLDPFMGSGTTGIAASCEGFNFIGIEMEEDYIEIARHRIEDYVEPKEQVMEWL